MNKNEMDTKADVAGQVEGPMANKPIYEKTHLGYRLWVRDDLYPQGKRRLGELVRMGNGWDWNTAPTERRVAGYGCPTREAAKNAVYDALGMAR